MPDIILHLTHTDITRDSRIIKSINAGITAGHSVFGFGIQARSYNQNAKVNFKDKNIDNIEIYSRRLKWTPGFIRHLFTLIEYYFKVLRRSLRINPTIIHCNDYICLLLSIFIKIKNNGVLIYDAHELESLSAGHSRLKSKCVFLYEKLLWRYIDGLIVVSQSIGLWYMNNIGNKPYEIILNSPLITINNNKTNTSYLREHFCIPPHHKIFIYVGLLRIGRSLDLIIKAFSQLEESASVVFLGYGPLKDELKNNSCMFSNIYFHPPVPHYEVVSLTKSADFGLCLIENVSLSDYYSLPNKIFEYAFASKPILASNFPEISLFIQKHRMGQVCELNLRSILASIRYLIYDYKFNSTLPDLSHYSWETQKKNLIKFYTKICK